MRAVAPIKSAKLISIIISICFVAFGIVLLCLPDMSGRIIGIALGTLTAVFGCAKLAGYFSKDLFRLAYRYDLQLGIAAVVTGILIAVFPDRALIAVCVIFGTVLLIDGLFRSSTAIEAKKFGIRPWSAILASAIATCTIGILLMIFPTYGVQAGAIMLGIAMITEGVSNLITVLTTVKIIKHQQPDTIDAEYEICD